MTMNRKPARRRRRGLIDMILSPFRQRPWPVWLVCCVHVAALGIALLLYALPHHVIPHGETAVGVVSSRAGAVQESPAPADSATGDMADVDEAPSPEAVDDEAAVTEGEPDAAEEIEPVQYEETPASDSPEPEPLPVEDSAEPEAATEGEPVGNFRKAFADKFTSHGVKKTDSSYQSENVCVTIKHKYVDEIKAEVYVADIYVADISCMRTAFSQDTYGRGYTEWITKVATRCRSVVTINGDYYGSRSMGVIIRNGELFRDKKYRGDICVLYWDGHMEAFKSANFDTMTEMNKGAYQSWSFGPSLLDDGQVKKKFNCGDNLKKKNPRSAIGYFEPGHYCFVAVDGRNDVSRGATMTQLAEIMSGLGCKLAYNLDGGQTSLLAAGANLINQPSQGGRNSSDYIMVVDLADN